MTFSALQTNAIETAVSSDRRHAMSTSQRDRLKAYLLSDSYAFAEVIGGHQDMIPEFHAPISYAFCHLTDRLIHTLNDPAYESYVTEYIRAELTRRGIRWNTPEGREQVDHLLDIVNVRVYRGSFKSSVGTHAGGTFIATVDPNRTIWLVSNSDPNAWAFCGQIGETILSGDYQDWFPERVPTGKINEDITQAHVTLGGRTISHPQTNIEADGYQTKRISAHFDTFIVDDLVVKENSSPQMLIGVNQWIAGMPGFEMATRRCWQRFEGTRWADNDDHRAVSREELESTSLSIVIPIEVYEDGIPENILKRGRPTNPKLHPPEKISSLQAKYLSDEKEGPISWRCNALLDPSANSGRIFLDHVIDDKERRWTLVPLPDDDKFFVSIPKNGKPVVYDPMRRLDRVMTIDPSWTEGGDGWAVHVEGWDSDGDRIQLETKSNNDGQEGWINAAQEMDARWRVRSIGFDGGAYQDVGIQNLMRLDPRLRRLRSRMVKVPHNNNSKPYRIRQNVAEPLKMRKLFLDPRPSGIQTRDQMRNFKGKDTQEDGILDAISMAPAVARRKRSEADAQKYAHIYRPQIDPVTGCPWAA